VSWEQAADAPEKPAPHKPYIAQRYFRITESNILNLTGQALCKSIAGIKKMNVQSNFFYSVKTPKEAPIKHQGVYVTQSIELPGQKAEGVPQDRSMNSPDKRHEGAHVTPESRIPLQKESRIHLTKGMRGPTSKSELTGHKP
jgi:hypothetical protein